MSGRRPRGREAGSPRLRPSSLRSAIVAAAALPLLSLTTGPATGQDASGDGAEEETEAWYFPDGHGPALFGPFTEVTHDWMRAWIEDDVEGLLRLYAPGTTVLLPDSERFLRGPVLLAGELRELLPGVGAIQLVPLSVDLSEKMGTTHGLYRITDPSGEMVQRRGFFMMAFRRIDQKWRIRVQLFRPLEDQSSDTSP